MGKGAASDSPPADITNQENVSSQAKVSKQSRQQVRYRASVACASCRDRRIRCVVPKGQMECSQCKKTGTDCIIKNDDERRKPISKAYMSSLLERINLLEGILLEKGVAPPPAVHPPKTRQEVKQQREDGSSSRGNSEECSSEAHPGQMSIECRSQRAGEVPSPPDSANEDFQMLLQERDQAADTILAVVDLPKQQIPKESCLQQQQQQTPVKPSPPAARVLDPKQEEIVHLLLSTKGNLSFDQISGRLRFFGPTANSHVYAASSDKFDSREPPEQVRRAARIIKSLTTETYDYMMNLFWEYYNGVLLVIDQDAFEADRDSQNPKFYSSFLHITILAMAYRFADKDRDDMIKISLGNRESTLHRESKYMLDIELERPGGIPSVQALLILGDLECGVGRDNTGWMYSGMANRLAFDIGLHLDCSNNGLPEQEVAIRHMIMRACVIFDKYWALFLGRPTSIKIQDIGMDLLSKQFSLMFPKTPPGVAPENTALSKKMLMAEIYDQLVELMELAGRIVEIRDKKINKCPSDLANLTANESEDNAYLKVVELDRKLQNWYRRLPHHLEWKPANIKTAPSGFFLLHQQYHVSMILLHRPWAKYRAIKSSLDGMSPNSQSTTTCTTTGSPDPMNRHHTSATDHALGDPTSIIEDSRTSLSRSICTQQAVRVCRIFWQHRQRFDGKKIFVTGIQHAGTAAIALIAALANHQQQSDMEIHNSADWRSYLGYLEVISHAIEEMNEPYHPAERMDALLKAVIAQLKQNYTSPRTRTNSFAAAQSGSGVIATGSRAGLSLQSSVIPARRENPDSNQFHAGAPAQKKRAVKTTHSRRESEFARPPPPFSAAAPSQISLSRMHQQAGFSSSIFSFNHFNSSLQGSAIDTDERLRGTQDDFILAGQSSDSNCELQGTAIGGSEGLQPKSSHDFSFRMSDWVAGPAGLSASSVLNISEGNDSRRRDTCTRGKGSENARANMDSWMDSPISLEGLVSSVEKAAGAETDRTDALPRNHELDFFSF